jgi:3-hydroxyacyl-CoA dehydrogenase
MGSSVAAHLANVGISSYLLDVVPICLLEEERSAGLTLQSPEVRNRLGSRARDALLKASPAPLYVPEAAELIAVGNIEDHLDRIEEVDWIIEAASERLKVKRSLLRRVERLRRPGVIVSSNTSSIPLAAMACGLSAEFRQHFLGMHFFSPTRYMRLLEVIPGQDTLPEVLDFMVEFGQRVLGKGVVLAKDSPQFIANRIVVYDMLQAFRFMEEDGLTVEEVDAVTGPLMGRPAALHIADLLGLDALLEVLESMQEQAEEGERGGAFLPPDFTYKMMDRGWLGDKTGQGFYRKGEGRPGDLMVLDYRRMAYRTWQEPGFPSMVVARLTEHLPSRLRALVSAPDQAGRFAWKLLKKTLLFAASSVPEIAHDLVSVDRAMKWGYNWDIGPFEAWDAIGLPESAARMAQEGERIPPWVEKLLHEGHTSFYREKEDGLYCFDLGAAGHEKLPAISGAIFLPDLKDRQQLVKSNPGASLLAIGDGVACLEFHSENNAIDEDVIEMIRFSVQEVGKNFLGLVVGNQGPNFSTGIDLLPVYQKATEGRWDELVRFMRRFQETMIALKYCTRPVVAAPFQMALMGGCEVVLAAARVQAAAETRMGMVEMEVGLLPAGGGIKEMLLRAGEQIPVNIGSGVQLHIDSQPFIEKSFQNIVMARVSANAREAQRLGFLRASDGITVNPDRLIFEAKEAVIRLAANDYHQPASPHFEVAGNHGFEILMSKLSRLKETNGIHEYDAQLAARAARILTGGDVARGTRVSEQYILDLELENFLSLSGDPRTLERIEYMLFTGRPLRYSSENECGVITDLKKEGGL